MIKGIDIYSGSHVAGNEIDWHAAANSGIEFTIIKVTQGTSYINPYWKGDTANANSAGVSTMRYAFPQNYRNASGEWNAFAAQLGSVGGTVWLDVEQVPGSSFGWSEIAGYCNQWNAFAKAAGFLTGMYCNVSWYNSLKPLGLPFGFDFLWLADPSSSKPSKPCDLWQYGQGPVPGFDTTIDLNQVVNEASFSRMIGVPDMEQTQINQLQQIHDALFTDQAVYGLTAVWATVSSMARDVAVIKTEVESMFNGGYGENGGAAGNLTFLDRRINEVLGRINEVLAKLPPTTPTNESVTP